MRTRVVAVAVAAAALLLVPVASRAAGRAFAEPGTKTVEVESLAGSTTKIAVPDGGGARPLVVASHGWSASGEHQLGWAKHFASWGFVVAVPSFPSPYSPDHQANAKIIADLVAELTGPSATKYGVAPGKVALEGHSAGGLATALAASKLAPAAVVLFDPVDSGGIGAPAYAATCAPVLGIFAQPSSCNEQAGWRAFATSTKGPVLAFDVQGSTHCDGENAARALCGTFCGGAASAERQAVYAHYATARVLARAPRR